jgi:hypothetical protein
MLEPYNTGCPVDSPICGRCHAATEAASHIISECVALAEFRFRRVGKHFCDEILLVRYCSLTEARDYWRNKSDGGRSTDQKVVAGQALPCAPTHLILITHNSKTLKGRDCSKGQSLDGRIILDWVTVK